jgi:diadenosine tetraphosphatase ApaH/serine/threonine PP2A family protein phosphatase
VSVRYLILSDIHANLDALDAVLAHASGAWDQVLVLGDLVGYGAEPNQVMDRIHALKPASVIRGNHDKAACGIDDGSQFNHVARLAAEWTGNQLTEANLDYLRNLPMGPVQIDSSLEICHGAPFDEDHYIFDGADALQALQSATRPLCLFGHTHLPVMFRVVGDALEGAPPDPDVETALPIESNAQYLVNVGSVGQPRDGDPRAAYGILDTTAREMRLRRVVYPVESAQRKILVAGLPASLANRLALGR